MNSQHLSDEAVAAYADGVLTGHARERATRHVNSCSECGHAVKVQREAAFVLRAAAAPAPPSALMDRLRMLPDTTPINTLPTVVAPDGTAMLATTLSGFAPMAALVPDESASNPHRLRPFITTAAVVALAGALAAGSVSRDEGSSQTGGGHPVRQVSTLSGEQHNLITPVTFLRGSQP
jgi:hypothetical protein